MPARKRGADVRHDSEVPLAVVGAGTPEFAIVVHQYLNSTVVPTAPLTVKPEPKTASEELKGEDREKLYHVVLLDDDHHTYDYVIEMLQKLFLLTMADAFQHAVEVDTTGRTIVITCERPQAEFARDQIQAYGADPRMPSSKGSMSAVLVPAGDIDVSS